MCKSLLAAHSERQVAALQESGKWGHLLFRIMALDIHHRPIRIHYEESPHASPVNGQEIVTPRSTALAYPSATPQASSLKPFSNFRLSSSRSVMMSGTTLRMFMNALPPRRQTLSRPINRLKQVSTRGLAHWYAGFARDPFIIPPQAGTSRQSAPIVDPCQGYLQ